MQISFVLINIYLLSGIINTDKIIELLKFNYRRALPRVVRLWLSKKVPLEAIEATNVNLSIDSLFKTVEVYKLVYITQLLVSNVVTPDQEQSAIICSALVRIVLRYPE